MKRTKEIITLNFLFFIIIFAYYNSTSSEDSIVITEREIYRSIYDSQSLTNNIVVYHETLILNNQKNKCVLSIKNYIPKDKYVVSEFFPAFGNSAIMNPPIKSEDNRIIESISVIPIKRIYEERNKMIFDWGEIEIEPRRGIIASFVNFFSYGSSFWTEEGFDILKINIFREAAINKENEKIQLNYIIQNNSSKKISNFLFSVFIPLANSKGEKILDIMEIKTSPYVEYYGEDYKHSFTDGQGNLVKGITFYIDLENLSPKDLTSLNISLKCQFLKSYNIFPSYKLKFSLNGSEKRDMFSPSSTELLQEKKIDYISIVEYDLFLQEYSPLQIQTMRDSS